MTPQLIVSLGAEDQLVVELPGPFATRRKIDLGSNPEAVVSALKRILHAQREGQSAIELDGAPTAAKLKHWQRHDRFPNTKCPHCWAEGRFREENLPPLRVRKRTVVERRPDGVEIRRLAEGQSGLSPDTKSRKNAADMGL